MWRGEGEGRGSDGDYRFGQQIVVSHDGRDYLIWEARSWRLTESGDYDQPALRESGFWRFVDDPADPSESQAIELLLAHSAGYVELFYGRPLNQSSWELATDALARSKTGMLVGGAKRLYGIVEGGDLAYVEERVDADGGLVPHLRPGCRGSSANAGDTAGRGHRRGGTPRGVLDGHPARGAIPDFGRPDRSRHPGAVPRRAWRAIGPRPCRWAAARRGPGHLAAGHAGVFVAGAGTCRLVARTARHTTVLREC